MFSQNNKAENKKLVGANYLNLNFPSSNFRNSSREIPKHSYQLKRPQIGRSLKSNQARSPENISLKATGTTLLPVSSPKSIYYKPSLPVVPTNSENLLNAFRGNKLIAVRSLPDSIKLKLLRN